MFSFVGGRQTINRVRSSPPVLHANTTISSPPHAKQSMRSRRGIPRHHEPDLHVRTQKRQLVVPGLDPLPIRKHRGLGPPGAREGDGDAVGCFRRYGRGRVEVDEAVREEEGEDGGVPCAEVGRSEEFCAGFVPVYHTRFSSQRMV